MTTVPSPLVAAAHRQPIAPSSRVESLDVFRGLTMILLISHGFGISEALKDNASLAWFRYQFDHAPWAGCTLWDLIQPAFTFIVGAAMPLALERRLAQGSSRASLFWHVVWRAMALVLLSNVLSNWGGTGPLKLQFINVLCQIAFSYLLCFLLWNLRFPIQVAAGAGIMVLHHALFFLFPGPNGPFDQTGNVGAVIDMALLGYNYSGLYTTLNFLGNAITVLFGVWVGMLLQSKRTQGERIRILAVCAAGAFAFGLLLELWVPMVKRLWLASFTFYSAGWVLLAFLACYWMVECRNWRSWGQPAVIVGMNSIFIYSFSQVLRGWLSRGIARFDGNFAVFGPYGAIAHNILVLAAMFGLCHWLYQRRIFFKL